MSKVITFGEIMMRLNPEGYLRFTQATRFEVTYAGSEANVAVAVANYGINAELVTKLPENDIGECAIKEIRRYGVETKNIARGGEKIGIYFVEKGVSQRASKVIYDRAGSSISGALRSDFNWNDILDGATWFHFSGITPALGEGLPEICMEALQTAKSKGIRTSCDLNYRKKLWPADKARSVMEIMMPLVDVCIANEEDTSDVFGIKSENTDINSGKLDRNGYVSVAEQLTKRFGFKSVAITLRGSISASENDWAGILYTDSKAFFSPTYRIRMVDRVGGGDSFGGALIYALCSGYGAQDAINFAVAGSCLKQTIEHDFSLVSVAEAEALAVGNASGRVQR